MTVRLTPEKKRVREYSSKPFKNRKEAENLLKEILDLMDKEMYQEARSKTIVFVPKLETTVVNGIIKQAQDSKKQDKD